MPILQKDIYVQIMRTLGSESSFRNGRCSRACRDTVDPPYLIYLGYILSCVHGNPTAAPSPFHLSLRSHALQSSSELIRNLMRP